MDIYYLYALTLRLAASLYENGSWCGETHIQKNMYILDNIYGEAEDLKFTLYKHGPYSFILHDLINDLYGLNFIIPESTPPYGPRIKVSESGFLFLNKYRLPVEKINSITSLFANKSVQKLEKESTALMIEKQYPKANITERAHELHRVKPHISLDDALTVTHSMEGIREKLLSSIKIA